MSDHLHEINKLKYYYKDNNNKIKKNIKKIINNELIYIFCLNLNQFVLYEPFTLHLIFVITIKVEISSYEDYNLKKCFVKQSLHTYAHITHNSAIIFFAILC